MKTIKTLEGKIYQTKDRLDFFKTNISFKDIDGKKIRLSYSEIDYID